MHHCRLLDILADRKAKKGLLGHVLVNGRRQPHNFKCASAYVVQVSNVCSVCVVCVYVCVCVCVCVQHTLVSYSLSHHNAIQDDVVVGTLSVKENLMFSAALRLPKSYSWLERKEKVDTVIDELGLQKCAKSRVCIYVLISPLYRNIQCISHTCKF